MGYAWEKRREQMVQQKLYVCSECGKEEVRLFRDATPLPSEDGYRCPKCREEKKGGGA